jgi:ribosomal protein S21
MADPDRACERGRESAGSRARFRDGAVVVVLPAAGGLDAALRRLAGQLQSAAWRWELQRRDHARSPSQARRAKAHRAERRRLQAAQRAASRDPAP